MSGRLADRDVERTARHFAALVSCFGDGRVLARVVELLAAKLPGRVVRDRGPVVVAVAAYRAAHPEASANEVQDAPEVPYARGDVLWAVRELRAAEGRYCVIQYRPSESAADGDMKANGMTGDPRDGPVGGSDVVTEDVIDVGDEGLMAP